LGFNINVIDEDIIYGDVKPKVGHIHIKVQLERYWRPQQLFMEKGANKED
jgi:hypothetical protein